MKLIDNITITHDEASRLDEEVLRRWLCWALKGDPAEARIKRESMSETSTKQDILNALTWIGAIQ